MFTYENEKTGAVILTNSILSGDWKQVEDKPPKNGSKNAVSDKK